MGWKAKISSSTCFFAAKKPGAGAERAIARIVNSFHGSPIIPDGSLKGILISNADRPMFPEAKKQINSQNGPRSCSNQRDAFAQYPPKAISPEQYMLLSWPQPMLEKNKVAEKQTNALSKDRRQNRTILLRFWYEKDHSNLLFNFRCHIHNSHHFSNSKYYR